VVVTLDGRDYTPPVHCGLLAGCERAELLARGELEERVIRRDDLHRADRIRLINSVRGLMDADLLHP
jgi:branched-subunit amino acid aminotransferase/4-amino-4-deoxychorismate lyase